MKFNENSVDSMKANRKQWATILKMTVLESYLELGELLTIRYDPNDLSG